MHHWTGSEGVRLAGDSWGEASAPLVMLLHGGGQRGMLGSEQGKYSPRLGIARLHSLHAVMGTRIGPQMAPIPMA